MYEQSPREILAATAHRPWPLRTAPWVMQMEWRNLLFAHWKVDPEKLCKLLPSGLELDLHHGDAWLGVVPFLMRRTRARWLPPIPGVSDFPELNVRTYVTRGGKPGVWFFSLDAANVLAVRGARALYRLPYMDAKMEVTIDGSRVVYRSERVHRGEPAAAFRASYQPVGPPQEPQTGTLDHWLTERYCLYAADPWGNILRGEIQHVRWPLQPAAAEIEVNTMTEWLGIPLEGDPVLHYAHFQDVIGWMIEKV